MFVVDQTWLSNPWRWVVFCVYYEDGYAKIHAFAYVLNILSVDAHFGLVVRNDVKHDTLVWKVHACSELACRGRFRPVQPLHPINVEKLC